MKKKQAPKPIINNQVGYMNQYPGQMASNMIPYGQKPMNQPQTMGNQPPMMGNQPPMMGNQPPMMGQRPGMDPRSGLNPKMMGNQSGFPKNQ